jgi:hypothetical protein
VPGAAGAQARYIATMTRSFRLACLTALGVAALASPAAANTRPATAQRILFAPGHPNDLYLQATFGLLESHDAGATWRWVCEQTLGYDGLFDPHYAVTATSALVATSFDGVKVRHDGCTYELTNLGAAFVQEVATDAAGTTIYAGVSEATTNEHRIWKSTDDGKTFAPTAATPANDEAGWPSIRVAPSNASIVYAAGFHFVGGVKTQTLYRSSNAGGAWTPVAGLASVKRSSYSDLAIAAISPDDPDFFLLTVTKEQGDKDDGLAVYRTIDGAGSFTLIKKFSGFAPGFVIRKLTGPGPASTKAEVVLGTILEGIYDSHDGGQTFTASPLPPDTIHVQCLSEQPGTNLLWACGADLPPDAMSLGKSPTPDSWTKVLQFRDIKETTQCGAGTTQHDTCELERWCGFRDQIGVVANPTGCISSGADAAPLDGAPMVKPKGCCDAGGNPAGALLLGIVGLVPFLRRRPRESLRRRH